MAYLTNRITFDIYSDVEYTYLVKLNYCILQLMGGIMDTPVFMEFTPSDSSVLPGLVGKCDNGAVCRVFESEVCDSYLASVSWHTLGADITVSTNAEPLRRWTQDECIQWCKEVVETGPELAVEIWLNRHMNGNRVGLAPKS